MAVTDPATHREAIEREKVTVSGEVICYCSLPLLCARRYRVVGIGRRFQTTSAA